MQGYCLFKKLFTCGRYSCNVIPARGFRHNKKGGRKGRKLPINWRKIDHNPAKIPWAWIPEKWKEENTIDYEREKELAQYMPEYKARLPETEDPSYQYEACYKFSESTKLIEGLSQALCLTKSVLYTELPCRIKELEEIVSLEDQDNRVIEVFRHALLFDIDPKNLDKENVTKREKLDNFKVFPTLERYCPNILENMIRLCQSHPSVSLNLNKRLIAKNIGSTAFFRRICDLNYDSATDLEKNWLVSVDSLSQVQSIAEEPLPLFAELDEVEKTASLDLPDIFPVFPIVDLEKTHIYEPISSTGLMKGFSHRHLHTIVIHNLFGFKPDEMYAQMACQLFAHLHSRAVVEFGNEPTDLPSPICGQAIASGGQNYQFMCMQLNTTKLDSNDGVKNMVWISGREVPHDIRTVYSSLPMFESCSHRVWQSPDYYTGYDPTVFQTFLAIWLNGVM